MSNLSKREAANLTMQILQSTTRNYIDIPAEFINYAAAANLYVTAAWPTDDPISNLPSANARGPEMANAIVIYTKLCSKTLSFRFTRTGTWNLTQDPKQPVQTQDYLNQQAALPRPGTVNLYRGYRYIDNGATGNGTNLAAISSWRKISGLAPYTASGTSIKVDWTGVPVGQYDTVFQFDVDGVPYISRFALTYCYHDDWVGVYVNGTLRYLGCGAAEQDGTAATATKLELLRNGVVDIGSAVYAAVTERYVPWDKTYNLDLRPFLIQGTNTIQMRFINGRGPGIGRVNLDLVQSVPGPTFSQSLDPDAPGYAAVVSGNASYSKLVNLLNNLSTKLYAYMVGNVYSIDYCHTNCHNNCHSNR